MEVHRHPHHVMQKKNWSEYLLEFLMLFLAVFLGFLAENQREHFVDLRREKEYMVSMMEDLKTDSTFLSLYSHWRTRNDVAFDSLELIFRRSDYNKFGRDIYRYSWYATAFGSISVSARTIRQLENSGGLRLIRNKNVAQSINRHYLYVDRLQFHNETQRMFRMKLLESQSFVLDGATLADFYNFPNQPVFNGLPDTMRISYNFPNQKVFTVLPDTVRSFRLASNSPEKINAYLNDIVTAKYFNRQVLHDVDSAQRSTLGLMKLIKSEYHLK